ncbi:hypothetical protein RhiJN_08167 [Ceratobasidium sp. AG-Ba]|nr:hypothetical protein RhiJN_08167 [Ceratobasidium sp. AG-Ba]
MGDSTSWFPPLPAPLHSLRGTLCRPASNSPPNEVSMLDVRELSSRTMTHQNAPTLASSSLKLPALATNPYASERLEDSNKLINDFAPITSGFLVVNDPGVYA